MFGDVLQQHRNAALETDTADTMADCRERGGYRWDEYSADGGCCGWESWNTRVIYSGDLARGGVGDPLKAWGIRAS